MADAEHLWRTALRWEKELVVILQDQPTGRNIEHAISQLREAYVNIVFVDPRFALDQDVEGRIWNKHHKIIERYRNILNQFREANGRKKPVELRKLQNTFVNFIKQATRFYRGFIQRLVSHFGVLELDWVVRKFNLSIDTPPNASTDCDLDTKNNVIRSCHRTLVFLGDLSRYREASQSPKNWGPATGYYTLAKKLVPSSGSPHNQLAVIALNEGSNLSATYHLYRALSVAEPFPEAGDNLGLGFRKVLKAHKAGNLGVNLVRKEEQAVSELIALFVRLHAKCFTGKEFSEYEALESEMLTQLALDLKERTLSNGMLSKLVLINIAAQFYAAERSKERGFARAHASFLRLNITTFTTLHQVFQPELERAVGDKTENEAQNVSAVGRRMLPGLRLYSTWLRVCHQTLTDQLADTSMSVLIKQLWQTYANTLSLLAATFPVERLHHLEYLLDEDDDTIGFLPFDSVNGEKKFNWEGEPTEQVHPNDEMLARILFLLEDGGHLCRKENVPITIVNGTITYQEDGILTSTPSIGMNSLYRTSAVPPTYERMGTPDISNIPHQSTFQSREDEYSDDENDAPCAAESVLAHGGTSIIESTAGSETMSIMNRMVDSLVGPREDPSSDDDEEILFSGRKKKKEARRRAARRGSKDHERHDGIPEMPRMKTPETVPPASTKKPSIASSPTGHLYTAKDLAAIVQNFTTTHQPPLHYPSTHSQELPTTPTHPQQHPHNTVADMNSPNNVTVSSASSDWIIPQSSNKSPVVSTMPDPSSIFFPDNSDMDARPQHPSSYIPYPGTVGGSWGSPHNINQETPPNGQSTVFGSGTSSSVFSRGRERE